MNIKTTLKRTWKILHGLLVALGLLAVLVFLLSFSRYPWKMYVWISRDTHVIRTPPEYIVVLGGGGIPSESGLIRSWYAAEDALRYAQAKVIVALPDDPDMDASHLDKMVNELILRGVAGARVLTEPQGRNTREQALYIRDMLGPARTRPVLLVTSGPHMKRSLLTFRKLGFTDIGGCIAEDESVEADLTYDPNDLGGRRNVPSTGVGGNTFIRYRWWNNLQYILWTAREGMAIAYYWLRGWI
ncbi:MAG: YdcF family protein [Spartobacteria bacterium]|nr:YdcF family protein [Spartobacteria bacterium]